MVEMEDEVGQLGCANDCDVGGRPTDFRFVACVDTSAGGSSHDADGEVKLTIGSDSDVAGVLHSDIQEAIDGVVKVLVLDTCTSDSTCTDEIESSLVASDGMEPGEAVEG